MALVNRVVACALLLGSSWAVADCVNYDKARAERAGAALARNAPTAEQLGLPSLDGWTLDAVKTAGDPQCDPSKAKPGLPRLLYYTTPRTMSEVIQTLYPNIKRRVEVDGMGRQWFKNPNSANRIILTSGTELLLQTRKPDGSIWQIVVTPPTALSPLVVEQQPYSVAEIVEGTPWPGGAKGPRQFVRADGGGATAPAAAPVLAAPPRPATDAAAPTAAKPAACPPTGSGGGGTAVAAAEVGAAVGGALGRSLGGALGGVFGSSQPKPEATAACP